MWWSAREACTTCKLHMVELCLNLVWLGTHQIRAVHKSDVGCIRACGREHPFLTIVTTRSLVRLGSNLADLFRSPDTVDLFQISETASWPELGDGRTYQDSHTAWLESAARRRRRSWNVPGDGRAGRGRRQRNFLGLGDSGAGKGSERQSWPKIRYCGAGSSSETP